MEGLCEEGGFEESAMRSSKRYTQRRSLPSFGSLISGFAASSAGTTSPFGSSLIRQVSFQLTLQMPSGTGFDLIRRNSQLRPEAEQESGDQSALIGHYQLSNISNMDQTPLPFEYLEGQTYNKIGEKTIWAQSSQSGWDKCNDPTDR